MPFDLATHPGRLFVLAAALPLLPVVVLLAVGTARHLAGWKAWATKLPGYFSVLCLAASAVLAGWGTVKYFKDAAKHSPDEVAARWAERFDYLRIGDRIEATRPSFALQIGYRIDPLAALLFTMVAGVGTLIFLFALGYMADETKPVPLDPRHPGGAMRRGRFGRFYVYLSLFAFSMLNLLVADNLLQIFACWELVGTCSFFLIGFYYERKSASTAANKAFVMNRIGDAGFLVGIAVAFAAFGTLNVHDLTERFAGGEPGIPHGLWVALGLGLFLGAVGKSAQVPLHTWLPDAMEGPTPVSALIHAATMVAAGVYLVGRCHPLFAPEVLLVIAYTGLVTLVLSASVAVVATDIKRVLAFSTGSQLGYMMLALGVGGWTAGLLHLLTHAFFKALLFLAAGSVIHGLHHEQDLRRMGGLRRKMPITAYAMLAGVLAIAGTPLFSGWYSKDMILTAALGFGLAHPQHLLLFVGPLVVAAATAFYMLRLWFLAFGGEPRDRHLYDHAHESPAVMTLPLIVLAVVSVGVAWGWPVSDAEKSYLGGLLASGKPESHLPGAEHVEHLAEENRLIAGGLALVAAAVGAVAAWVRYGKRPPTAAQLADPRGPLAERWYFDAVYDRGVVPAAVFAAEVTAALDRTNSAEKPPGGDFTLDGFSNGFAAFAGRMGGWVRSTQTGRIRGYVLVLAATVVGLLGLLSLLSR